ncbi:MAG: hypothetical protein ACT4QG_11090 [Sporichthyaceae bacterium]
MSGWDLGRWQRPGYAIRPSSWVAKPGHQIPHTQWTTAGRALGVAGAALEGGKSAWGQWQTDADDPNLDTSERLARAGFVGAASGGGAWAGAYGGALAGGAIGSVFPGPGTVIGAAIGGALGGMGGSAVGENLAELVVDPVGEVYGTVLDGYAEIGQGIASGTTAAFDVAGDVGGAVMDGGKKLLGKFFLAAAQFDVLVTQTQPDAPPAPELAAAGVLRNDGVHPALLPGIHAVQTAVCAIRIESAGPLGVMVHQGWVAAEAAAFLLQVRPDVYEFLTVGPTFTPNASARVLRLAPRPVSALEPFDLPAGDADGLGGGGARRRLACGPGNRGLERRRRHHDGTHTVGLRLLYCSCRTTPRSLPWRGVGRRGPAGRSGRKRLRGDVFDFHAQAALYSNTRSS